MAERIDIAIVGGGQAGLATSHELTQAGIEHVLLERGRLGETWRTRWDDEHGFPLHTRKSSLLCGVGEDAAVVAEQLVAARA